MDLRPFHYSKYHSDGGKSQLPVFQHWGKSKPALQGKKRRAECLSKLQLSKTDIQVPFAALGATWWGSIPTDPPPVGSRTWPHTRRGGDTSLQMVKLKQNAAILQSPELNSQLLWEPISGRKK